METLANSSQKGNRTNLSLENRLIYLEQKAKEMEESIRYASSLQQSILPNERMFINAFKDAFVLFKPKDIVSGDFHWIAQYDNDIYFAVGDCTGHGIPGAMVNFAGNALLRQIIRREGFSNPADIMSILDKEIVSLFNDNLTTGETRDGMDIAFCRFNLDSMKGYFCGAGRPLILVRNGELEEIKKGNSSIGYNDDTEKIFKTVEFDLMKGDKFYLFSDGYTDQFGGDNVKKFNRRRFRNLLQSLSSYSMKEQKKELSLSYENWKGNQEQIDDVCVVGVEL